MLATALATAAALGLAPRLFTGFVDAAVHRLLGIDGAREVALALLSVGPETPPAASASVSAPIEHATLPLSRHVVDEPLVAQAHAASALATPEDVVRWRAGRDRKSTRLNSSHGYISYAVFCLKKKTIAQGHLPAHPEHLGTE